MPRYIMGETLGINDINNVLLLQISTTQVYKWKSDQIILKYFPQKL